MSNLTQPETQGSSTLPSAVVISPTIIEAKPITRAQAEAVLEALNHQNRLKLRTMICWFLIITLGMSVVFSYALVFYYLASGHSISEGFLKWLCGATIAQTAVFLGVFVRSVWPKEDSKPLKSA
jgi:hypothetical protein